MQNYYQFIVARMDGATVARDFGRCRGLVKKGIGGFIIFGGDLAAVRRHVRQLQEEAPHTLIIASDLERGLGQQLRGGTHFPPAMAFTSALGRKGVDRMTRREIALLRDSFAAVAEEAAYAGINTVFAPVLDINTNPRNPIIAARAFGEDSETVSFMGVEMIRAFRKAGIAACGKHFPGHGDTRVDSHMHLPTIRRSLASLRRRELVPFQRAMDAGVAMIMLGHLAVPCLDPTGRPATLSERAVSYIRQTMGYDGILITDAMNMGGIGAYEEDEACLMALKAGVEVILHPLHPDRVVARLKREGSAYDTSRLERFRKGLLGMPGRKRPAIRLHQGLAAEVASRSIQAEGLPRLDTPFLVVLNDDDMDRGQVFIRRLKRSAPRMRHLVIKRGEVCDAREIPPEASPIVAVFSETRGWKGGSGAWLLKAMKDLDRTNAVFISFGSPYILNPLKKAAKVRAYWDGIGAQEAAADVLVGHGLT